MQREVADVEPLGDKAGIAFKRFKPSRPLTVDAEAWLPWWNAIDEEQREELILWLNDSRSGRLVIVGPRASGKTALGISCQMMIAAGRILHEDAWPVHRPLGCIYTNSDSASYSLDGKDILIKLSAAHVTLCPHKPLGNALVLLLRHFGAP